MSTRMKYSENISVVFLRISAVFLGREPLTIRGLRRRMGKEKEQVSGMAHGNFKKRIFIVVYTRSMVNDLTSTWE
jgi:hypothetical protein